MKQIICPFCFKEFYDEEMHFRAPKSTKPDLSMIPEEFESIEEIEHASEQDIDPNEKKRIIKEYEANNLYISKPDAKYEKFWKQFGSTSELDTSHDGFPQYKRRVFEPRGKDAKYVKKQSEGDIFIRDQGVVTAIELTNGDTCEDAVCPHCHNLLPEHYGFYPIKFITLIGITGSGKTVFLSQFLKHFRNELPKVGFTVPGYTSALTSFVRDNAVKEHVGLPSPSATGKFELPIICEIDKNREKQTIVLYDVAGEYFGDNEEWANASNLNNFAPYVKHSDAIIILVSPFQFENIRQVKGIDKEEEAPDTAIVRINGIMHDGNITNIPVAVCLSKSDTIYDTMDDDLATLLTDNYEGVTDPSNSMRMQTVFDAKDFNRYEEKLARYIHGNAPSLDQTLSNLFDDYGYFALSALGCDVENDNGVSKPIGPIVPHRIHDPFYWIMYKLGLLAANEGVYNPNGVECPQCHKRTTYKYREAHEYERGMLIFKKKFSCTHFCGSCRYDFNPETGDFVQL